MSILRLAWRNVWRNARRTGVTIAATTFALWVMVLYSGLVQGFLDQMARDVVDFEVGELQATAPGFDDDPSLYHLLPDADVTALEAAGYRASARLVAGALGASGEQSSGIVLRGVDPARERAALRIADRMAEGAWLDPADPRGVVIGRRVAKALGVTVGGEIIALTQGADGSLANELFTVRGVLGSVGDATDRSAVLVPIATLREMLAVPAGAQQIVVRIPTAGGAATTEELVAREAAVAALVPDAQVRSWREILPFVATMLDASAAMIYLVFFLIYVTVGILVLNAMLMAVFERIREFGVMKALGTGPWLVFRVILLEAAIQVGLATALALVLAAPVGVYLVRTGLDLSSMSSAAVSGVAMPPVWYATFTPQIVATPVIALLGVVAAAVTWPAVRAARLRPLDAMRYQ
ncbi:MAG: FtsX-like permease family protein [Myxococcota bacterium]